MLESQLEKLNKVYSSASLNFLMGFPASTLWNLLENGHFAVSYLMIIHNYLDNSGLKDQNRFF